MGQAGVTLGEIVERNDRLAPDGLSLVHGDLRLTHSDFADKARRLGSALYRLGTRHQDRIAILAMNCPEYTYVYAAGELAGFITATLNFRLAAPELLHIVNDSAPRVLVFETQYADTIDRLRAEIKTVETYICIGPAPDWAVPFDELLAGGDAAGAPLRAKPGDIAYLIYTSGTTGRPKGCMLGHNGAAELARMNNVEMATGPADKALVMMPLFHIGGKGVLNGLHWRGGAVVLHRGFDPALILRTIAAERIAITHMAPTMVQAVLEHESIGRTDLSSLRTLFYSAAAMPTPVLRRGLELLGNGFMQIYGQTEGPVSVLQPHQHKPDGSPRERARLASVGQPIQGVEVRVVDDDGRDCPVGTAGEIVHRSSMVCHGYWNNSPASIDLLRDGWCHTGDVGRFDADGFLYLVDRKKDMIVSGGENIYSREVEEAVLQHPAVSEVAVIGMPDPKWGEAVRAVVTLRPGMTATEAEIIETARALIASYKKPRSVVFVPELPKLASGKIDKVQLRKMFATEA